jgi:ribosomal protein L39E
MAEVKTVNDDAKLPLQAATTSISEEVEKLINEHKSERRLPISITLRRNARISGRMKTRK